MTDSTQRFSSRVENYVKYRPSYPHGVMDVLRAKCALVPEWTIADVGSGTGISSELFLRNGNPVFGVEPNADMRNAAERLLAAYPNFISQKARSENTALPNASIDLIVAGQAFHWFEPHATRREFARILKPHGWVVLMWNSRLNHTAFAQAYEQMLLTYSDDYAKVNHVDTAGAAQVAAFFAPATHQLEKLPNAQVLDYAGIEGRLMSSSYAPEANHPNHAPMLRELKRIFGLYSQNGRVTIPYETEIYLGQLQR